MTQALWRDPFCRRHAFPSPRLVLLACASAVSGVGAVAPGAATLAPPPPPPDTVDFGLTVVLIIVAFFLFVILCGLVVYVCMLQKAFKEEQDKMKESKQQTRQSLLQKRDEEEKQMLNMMDRQMDELREEYHENYVRHVKFLKDHNPEMFEQAKENGDILIDGEDSVMSDSERDIDQELKDLKIRHQFTEEEKAELERVTDSTNKATGLRKEMRALRRLRKERKEASVLEDEKLGLEQKLAEMDLEEKMDSLMHLEKKQREREELDNMRRSKRLAVTENGEYIISRMGGAAMEYDQEPYDSEFDFDDRIPELPAHLDDMNPRGKLLKKKLDELRVHLDQQKAVNSRRENEIDRDITLMRLRLQQQNRKIERHERSIARNASSKKPAVTIQDPSDPASADVPLSSHEKVPHFITQPWNVEGINPPSKRGGAPRRRRLNDGKGRGDADLDGKGGGGGGAGGKSIDHHLLGYIADAMMDENAQQEALDSGLYLQGAEVEQASPLRTGLHPDALPNSSMPPSVQMKRLVL
eukprot:TRINITY_DN32297_c0_g1_i1.p1 TRINITY_DN32297_c0_g1~~TRINITY_DN32297_c0_g1_i1.p1  ORF type:complete len:526 (+),score=200.20 TRINITY_DN32297_c0_g1_i1:402-1979(+)